MAEERSVQLRLSSVLAGQPALQLRVVSSLRRMIAAGAADDLIVSYHETLCADDCDTFKQMKTRFPELLIVAVCESADGRAVRRALDSGIDGSVFADELEAALRPTVAAASGGADRRAAQPTDVRTQAVAVRERAESPRSARDGIHERRDKRAAVSG